MIGELMLQTRPPIPADIINLTGIGLLLIYTYFHFQYKQAKNDEVRRETRRKSIGILLGFLFYSVIVGTYGGTETWVGQIGLTVDSYFRQFGRQLVLSESPTRGSGLLGPLVGGIKTIGLIAYVLVTAVVSMSAALPIKVLRSIL